MPPERIVDYLALIGDSVDNIPGVDKVGPKTAAKWIAEHGSLDGVIAAAPTIKGVVGENLRKALDWLPQGRRLVTVVDRLRPRAATSSAGRSSTALALGPIDAPALMAFYDRYGFALDEERARDRARPARPRRAASPPAPSARRPTCRRRAVGGRSSRHYETVTTLDALDAWVASASRRAELTALDIETDSLDPVRAR